MSKGKYYFSKSLEKGLKILSLFDEETRSLTQSKISKALPLNMTSTYRYINTLVELGFLEKNNKTKIIRPSVKSLVFCTNLLRAADHLRLIKGVIDPIHQKYNISIEVVFTINDALVRFYNKEAAETLTYSLPNSTNNCLHNTALGKAYLSTLPENLMKIKVKDMTLTPKTLKTIQTKEKLISELLTVKYRGYAMSVEEYLPGLISIGVPLIDPLSRQGVGAVSFDFSIIQNTAEDIQKKYADLIITTGETISGLLPPEEHRR